MFSQTRFSQLLKFIPRAAFNTAVKQSQADRYAKKVSSWDLLVTLLLGQLTQARSLRSLAVTSQSLQPHSYHLNATSLSRSTLSDALQKRSCEPLKGSSRNPGKDRNKNADLRDDVSANKHILKPAFLCTILIRFCPFGRAFLSLQSGLTATTC